MTDATVLNTAVKAKRFQLTLSAPMLIIGISLWISLVANQTLWGELSHRLAPLTLSSFGYFIALASLMVLLLSTPLLIIGQRWLLKPALITVLLLSGTLAYFTQQLGVIFDIEMVRNIVETIRDRNVQEGAELISSSMIGFVLLTMAVPIVVVAITRVNYGSFRRDLLRRMGWWLGLLLVTSALVLVNFKYVTYVSRENNDLEVYLTPFYTLKTAKQLAKRHYKARELVFNQLGEDAIQVKLHNERRVGIMVVGETARRGNFGLNGYSRNTTPELAKRNVINFNQATSCGTSTAYSVPCMFSFLDQDSYSPESAGQQSNVLDVLETAGIKTFWVDSNSSCKGVCERIESANLLDNPNTESPLFVDGAWQDEILLEHIDDYLNTSTGDVLLVLHTMGSHGPAYYRRYPESRAVFSPYCQSKAPQDCTSEEIVNAYDNTIAYTDYVLASIIDKLDARKEASFLLYASDHGESLGENGIYLHGLPRFIAPDAQTEVPVIVWFSDRFLNEKGLPSGPKQPQQISAAITHDNLSASLLGLFDVKTGLYKPALDLFQTEGAVFNDKSFVKSESHRFTPHTNATTLID